MAHAQGLLTRPSLNQVQTWALQYWIYMERRGQLDDKQAELELQTWNLFPERWGQLYRDQMLGTPANKASHADRGEAFGGEAEIPVTVNEIDKVTAWYDGHQQARRFSGADIAPYENDGMPGIAFGPGRRV